MDQEIYGIKWHEHSIGWQTSQMTSHAVGWKCTTVPGYDGQLEYRNGVGLRISQEKSKILDILDQHAQEQSVNIRNEKLENVERFTYLRSCRGQKGWKGDVETDVNIKIGKAAAVFRRLNNVWGSQLLWISLI